MWKIPGLVAVEKTQNEALQVLGKAGVRDDVEVFGHCSGGSPNYPAAVGYFPSKSALSQKASIAFNIQLPRCDVFNNDALYRFSNWE